MTPISGAERDEVRRVSWAVQAAARNVPLGFVCLPQAVAGKWMLRRRGIPSTLYLGLGKKDQSDLHAHAWLRAGSVVLTGRRESRNYKAVGSFADAPEFPSELDALLILVRATCGRDGPLPAMVPDVPTLIRCIARHRLGALLHHRLPDRVREDLSGDILRRLRQDTQANALRSLAQVSELLALAALFRDEKIAFVSVKGPLLARSLYGDFKTRHAGDLDLLIDRADLLGAEAILLSRGYRRTRPAFEMADRQLRHYAEKEFEYRGGPHDLRVELAWRLDGVGDLAALMPGAAVERLEGSEIHTLPAALNVLYLFQHGAKHGWRRLFWLLDAALLLDREGIDWEDIMRRARARGIERAVLEGAALAEGLLGVPRPRALLPSSGERKIIFRLSQNSRAQIALPAGDMDGLGNFFRDLTHRIRLQKSIVLKWRELTPHLFSARNWEAIHLPDWLFWLYFPLAPLLWIGRRISSQNSR